jgi:hypothetical protein
MKIYYGKERQKAIETMSANHMIMVRLTRRVVSCILSQEEINYQLSVLKVQSQPVYNLVFFNIPYKYGVLYHRYATTRERNISNNVKCHTFGFTHIKFSFTSGLYKLPETIFILVKSLQNSGI